MKNLYKKGKVHPSLPSTTDHLALLPATILTLTAALSPQDKEVLAYLISCCGNPTADNHQITAHKSDDRGVDGGGGRDHCPRFECNCFSCYMSFWARWDNSPNRQLIHEIIEAYEEGLFQKKRKSVKKKKEKGKRVCDELKDNSERSFAEGLVKGELGELRSMEPSCTSQNEDGQVELEKDTVRKIASFIGEKIWGVWNRN